MNDFLKQIWFFTEIKYKFEVQYNEKKDLTIIFVDGMVYCYNYKDGSFNCKMHGLTYEEKFNK